MQLTGAYALFSLSVEITNTYLKKYHFVVIVKKAIIIVNIYKEKCMDSGKDIVRFGSEDINREQLFGTLDANIKQVEKATGTSIVMRDDGL